MYAGMTSGYLNRMSYVYSTQYYWTMSPSYYSSKNSSLVAFYFNSSGTMNNSIGFFGVRPVINLKTDTLIMGGIGTMNDPFVVS